MTLSGGRTVQAEGRASTKTLKTDSLINAYQKDAGEDMLRTILDCLRPRLLRAGYSLTCPQECMHLNNQEEYFLKYTLHKFGKFSKLMIR